MDKIVERVEVKEEFVSEIEKKVNEFLKKCYELVGGVRLSGKTIGAR